VSRELPKIIRLHHPTPRGFTTAEVDTCIAPLIQALNDGGFQTIASCCGHGIRPRIITLTVKKLLVLKKQRFQLPHLSAGWISPEPCEQYEYDRQKQQQEKWG